MPDGRTREEVSQSAPTPGVNVPMHVSFSKCKELIEAHSESDVLDYKRKIDLPSQVAYLDLAKDVAGMSVKGGYILVGVDDNGVPWLEDIEINRALWDEANLRQRLARHLPEGVQINVALHTIESRDVILIYVHPHKDGFIIMKADGQYSDENGVVRTKFSKGDIFTRHGTSTEKIVQSDIRMIIDQKVAVARDLWRSEIFGTTSSGVVNSLAQLDTATNRAAQPLIALAIPQWQMPVTLFSDSILGCLRNRNSLEIELLLHSITALVELSVTQVTPDLSLSDILDRIIIISSWSVVLNDEATFELSVEALKQVYIRGLDNNGYKRSDTLILPQIIWLEVLKRIYALGGLVVRKRRWRLLRKLVAGGPLLGEMTWFGNWFSHGSTEAARSNLFFSSDPAGNTQEVRLLVMAKLVAELIPELSNDVVLSTDALLDSICQFDILACLVALREIGSLSHQYMYPHSAEFYPERTTPVLDEIVSNREMRSNLGLEDDTELARILKSVLDFSQNIAVTRRIFPHPRSGQYLEWLNSHIGN